MAELRQIYKMTDRVAPTFEKVRMIEIKKGDMFYIEPSPKNGEPPPLYVADEDAVLKPEVQKTLDEFAGDYEFLKAMFRDYAIGIGEVTVICHIQTTMRETQNVK